MWLLYPVALGIICYNTDVAVVVISLIFLRIESVYLVEAEVFIIMYIV